MSYKIAGIDVHKKVLMVVVMDASTPESKPERRRFATMPSDLCRLSFHWIGLFTPEPKPKRNHNL